MSKVLFLFEGAVAEPGIFEATVNAILPTLSFVRNGDGVVCEYGTHIYSLYKRLRSDDGLDIVKLLLESPERFPQVYQAVSQNRDGESVDEETFEAIYLVFDYDGHVNMPQDGDGGYIDGDAALGEMLAFFDDASDNGRLLISYPMVEAIRHLDETPADRNSLVTTKCKGPHCPNVECPDRSDRERCPSVGRYYKRLVNELHPKWQLPDDISASDWGRIFSIHLRVGELICGSEGSITSQADILRLQLRDFVSRDCPHVAVMSAFPYLFIDLVGEAGLRSRLMALAVS